MSKRLIAWIGGVSLVALALLAVGGMAALRLAALQPEDLARPLTGAPGPDPQVDVLVAAPEGEGSVQLAQTVALSDEEKACAELMAKHHGHGAVAYKAAAASAAGAPMVFMMEAGEDGDGAVMLRTPGLDPQAILAEALGMTVEELREAMETQDMAELAKAEGTTVEELEALVQGKLREKLSAELDAKVEAGELTREQAEKQLASFTFKLMDRGHGLHMALEAGGPGERAARWTHRLIRRLSKDGQDDEGEVVVQVAPGGPLPFEMKLPAPMDEADQAAVRAVLDAAVADGRLERAQADAAIERLEMPFAMPAIHVRPAMPAAPAAPVAPVAPSER